MNDLSAVGSEKYLPKTREEYIAQYCFKLPGLATQMEDFVGEYMQHIEGVLEHEKKEEVKKKAANTRRINSNATLIMKLLRLTIFRDVPQIMNDLDITEEDAASALQVLMVSRKIRRSVMGDREVYNLMK